MPVNIFVHDLVLSTTTPDFTACVQVSYAPAFSPSSTDYIVPIICDVSITWYEGEFGFVGVDAPTPATSFPPAGSPPKLQVTWTNVTLGGASQQFSVKLKCRGLNGSGTITGFVTAASPASGVRPDIASALSKSSYTHICNGPPFTATLDLGSLKPPGSGG